MENIVDYIRRDNYHIRIIFFVIGMFIAAFSYNVFIEPNDLLIGGLAGLAIIEKNTIGINTTLFIDVCEIILVCLGIMFLGIRETFSKLLGCIVFPLVLTFTSGITSQIYFNLDSVALKITLAAIIYGFAIGIISRAGFGVFGTDIAISIISKKRNSPSSRVAIIANFLIVTTGIFVLSPLNILYSIYLIVIVNIVSNTIVFGTSSTKLIYIISDNSKEIEKELDKIKRINYTYARIKGDSLIYKRKMIVCVVHNAFYPRLKRIILRADKNAFILASKCYELNSSENYSLIPF